MTSVELPLPPHFDPEKIGEVWRGPYQDLAAAAAEWARAHGIGPAGDDEVRICLIAIDVQNTFCVPGSSSTWVVAPAPARSMTTAACASSSIAIWTHSDRADDGHPPGDAHLSWHLPGQRGGRTPGAVHVVSEEDVATGRWRFNDAISRSLGISAEYGQRHLEYYTRRLRQSGKYALTVWPYHAMLGGIGHALVSAFEEAIFFHTMARHSQPDFHVKGRHPLTEHYSVIGPEVAFGPRGDRLVDPTDKIMRHLIENDIVVIAGQAKSHCVAWTIADLLMT